MKRHSKNLVLLAVFFILTLVSIATVYALHQAPDKRTSTETIGTYTSTATYDYTATLEPSTIYEGKTTLKPDEGTLYAKLTKQIELTLTYTFDTTLSETATSIRYSITQMLETKSWQYQILTITPVTIDQKAAQINLPTFNKTEIEQTKNRIDNETGNVMIASPYYTLETTPTFTITATTPHGDIEQVFSPTLSMSLNHTDQGDIIIIGDLEQTKTDELTETQMTVNQDVIYQRYASYVLMAVSTVGLAFTAFAYNKQKTVQPRRASERDAESHRDLIIETAKEADTQVTNIINVKTLNELAKTAEILAKPIIHTKKDGKDTYYILDNNTKYQYEEDDSTPVNIVETKQNSSVVVGEKP